MEAATEYTNEQINDICDKHPLLAEGYAALECPNCNKLCFPTTQYMNGTVRYNKHLCHDLIMTWNEPKYKSFSILEDGSLKE